MEDINQYLNYMSEDEDMTREDISTVKYCPPRKRRKLVEDFEALSIEDEIEADCDEKVLRQFKDSNLLKSKYDNKGYKSGKRRRVTKKYVKDSMEDFSEIKKKLQEMDPTHHSSKLRTKK